VVGLPPGVYQDSLLSKTNILNANQNPRKAPVATVVSKLGELERAVLLYASTVARRFSPSDIVVAYNLKQYNGNANRRVYDSIQRLVKRGYLRKVDRGTYELAVDISPDLLKKTQGAEPKENLGYPTTPITDISYTPTSRSKSPSREYRTVRIHLRGVSGYLELYQRLQLARCFLDIAVRRLEDYLVRLGVSKYQIKKLRRYRYMCVDSLVVVGGHGKYKCKSKPLVPVAGGYFYEVGVDIVSGIGLPKFFMKVYTDTFTY